MPRLQVLNGKRQGEIFELRPGGETIIGHRETAPITIDDPWVSWDHARLFFSGGDRNCWIEDLGSTNGTYVNCVRVKRQELRHEDIVFLGKTHVIFLAPAAEAVPDDLLRDFEAPAGARGGGGGSPFVESEERPPLVLSPPSSAQIPSLEGRFPSSALGPTFESGSGNALPPLVGLGPHDPFASTGSRAVPVPIWSGGSRSGETPAARDPFSDSSIDPFSSGPDYSTRLGGQGRGSRPALDDSFGGGDDDLSFLAPKDPDPRLDPFGLPPLGGSAFDPRGSEGRPPAGLDESEEEDEFDPFALPPPRPASARSNPFAETRGDEAGRRDGPSRSGSQRSLSLSGIEGDDEPDLPGPSSQEISQLIGGADLYASYPGLLDRPSDAGAVPPPPASGSSSGRVPAPATSPFDLPSPFDTDPGAARKPRVPPSEWRTQEMIAVSDEDLRERLGEPAPPPPPTPSGVFPMGSAPVSPPAPPIASGAFRVPAPPAPPTPSGVHRPTQPTPPPGQPPGWAPAAPSRSGPGSTRRLEPRPTDRDLRVPGTETTFPAAVVLPTSGASAPVPAPAGPAPGGPAPVGPARGAEAFERARLEDEVQRLRLALQAAREQSPEAVRIAAQALRDQELGRLAQRVAELERDLAEARASLLEREAELDAVTEEMIQKEDEIERLRAGGSVSESGERFAPAREDDLSSLEF